MFRFFNTTPQFGNIISPSEFGPSNFNPIEAFTTPGNILPGTLRSPSFTYGPAGSGPLGPYVGSAGYQNDVSSIFSDNFRQLGPYSAHPPPASYNSSGTLKASTKPSVPTISESLATPSTSTAPPQPVASTSAAATDPIRDESADSGAAAVQETTNATAEAESSTPTLSEIAATPIEVGSAAVEETSASAAESSVFSELAPIAVVSTLASSAIHAATTGVANNMLSQAESSALSGINSGKFGSFTGMHMYEQTIAPHFQSQISTNNTISGAFEGLTGPFGALVSGGFNLLHSDTSMPSGFQIQGASGNMVNPATAASSMTTQPINA